MTAVHVNSLVIDPTCTSVRDASNGVPRARSARPYPFAKAVVPPDATETTAPGTRCSRRSGGMVESKNPAKSPGAQPDGWACAGAAPRTGTATPVASRHSSSPRAVRYKGMRIVVSRCVVGSWDTDSVRGRGGPAPRRTVAGRLPLWS
jgi:hypothetical protein